MAYLGISRRAARDIEEIYLYSFKQWGRRVAEDYLDALQEAFNRLREHPGLLRVQPSFSSSLYFHRIRSHYLVCSLIGDNTYVLTVAHASMDMPTRLAELEPELRLEVQLLHKTFLATMRNKKRA